MTARLSTEPHVSMTANMLVRGSFPLARLKHRKASTGLSSSPTHTKILIIGNVNYVDMHISNVTISLPLHIRAFARDFMAIIAARYGFD